MELFYTADTAPDFKRNYINLLLSELEARASRSAYCRKRYEEGLRLASAPHDGTIGGLEELLSHSSASTITRVRPQGKPDTFVKVEGRKKPVQAERKTNSGRIEGLYEASRTSGLHLVVYSLSACNAGTSYTARIIRPLVFEVHTFLRLAEACGAVHKIGGKRPQDQERMVQRSSLKWFRALEEYGNRTGLWYDPDRTYTLEEIERGR